MPYNFYPRPLRGGRPARQGIRRGSCEFLSTPSARRATEVKQATRLSFEFLSTPSARRATPRFPACMQPRANFYPRPLRGGRRFSLSSNGTVNLFLSTPSARRATGRVASTVVQGRYFYPRPLRGGRRGAERAEVCAEQFLSTPSARRATVWLAATRTIRSDFYPRPLRGGRLWCGGRSRGVCAISIHALCEEGDKSPMMPVKALMYFYPRPLRGGRQQKQRQNLYFQTNYTTFCTNLEEP